LPVVRSVVVVFVEIARNGRQSHKKM
jgi:hypothetical protein